MRDDARTMSRWKVGGAGVLACCAGTVAVVGAAALRVHLIGRKAIANSSPRGSTAVVFGARAFANGPSESLQARLDHALFLYKAGIVKTIAMAGGIPEAPHGIAGGPDEVNVMINYALKQGVPARALLELRPGQNTREQVLATKNLVIDAGRGPAIVVSSSFHLARISDEAHRCGFEVEPSAPAFTTEQDSTRAYLAYVLIDAIGTLWYALPPRLTAHVDSVVGSSRHIATSILTGEPRSQEALMREKHVSAGRLMA